MTAAVNTRRAGVATKRDFSGFEAALVRYGRELRRSRNRYRRAADRCIHA
jgi:hypothetical protein